ncbi:MAG: inositol monophosphatase, partial [Myxococcales bacterium]|nr:inositol monophosphatase [Myxococcales bacterium]
MTDRALAREAMEVAESIALRAGWIVLDLLDRRRTIERKRSAVDLVTDADRRSETFVVAELERRFPDHAIVAEEGGGHDARTPYRWHIDPVDGTSNYAHGYPIFCVSIALCENDRPIAGVVRAPALGETFKAHRGGGAYLNERRIGVSEVATLADALVATGFPYYRRERAKELLALAGEFMQRTTGIRRAGAAAWDLANVACGRLDAFWEEGLSSWDVAAGSLIIEEAGGRVSDYQGAPLDLYGPSIVATNGRLH